MDSKKLLLSLDLTAIPCEYCDVRIEESFESNVIIQNHEVTTSLEESSTGAFLRVRQNGQWYYSATTDLNTLDQQLRDLAKSPKISAEINWKMFPENHGTFENLKYQNDNPAKIPMSEKVQLLTDYDRLTLENPKIKTSRTRYQDLYKIKTYKNSSGTFYQYDFAQYGVVVSADLCENDKTFSDYCPIYAEFFPELHNKSEQFKKFLKDSEQFIHAPLLEPGKYKVVLAPIVAGVFVHESFGHNSEADSMIGDPNAKDVWKIGRKVAADFVSIVDSGLHQGTSGYCPIDDEGYKANKTYLIKDGILSGRLHSFDTALVMDEAPTGNARAINFEYQPIVRMTSTYIENGSTSLEDLYKQAEGGLFIEDYHNGTGGELFTIAPGRAYLIKDGKPSTPVRINVISGQLFETLLNIEAVANNFDLKSSAFGGCGKMEQFPLPVADGGPTILVKDMQVS